MAFGLPCGFGHKEMRPKPSYEVFMKLCLNCHRTSPGKPTFCSFCGASFNVRLCPRLHTNPRSAEICAECGSRELSHPQPKPNLLVRPLLWLLTLAPGVLLLGAFVGFVLLFIQKLFTDPNGLLPLMFIGLLLGILLAAWILLPNFLKKFLKRLFTHSSKGRTRERH